MPLLPFLLPIPQKFRESLELNNYFNNIQIYLEQVREQFVNAEALIEELQNEVEAIGGTGTGGNNGGGTTDPLEYQEAPLIAGIVGVDQPPSGFFFYTQNVNNTNFLITLPEFPEENYYLRAQVFLNNSITFNVENNRLLINTSSSVVLSGDGNLVDIRYSLSSNRYILT